MVVVYRAEPADLDALIARLDDDCAATVVVINGADGGAVKAFTHRFPRVTCLANAHNAGVAAAQNQGIQAARALGADAVLLLDQDSLPPAGGVAHLQAQLNHHRGQGAPVAAVGPAYHQGDDNPWPGFVRIRPWGLRRVRPRAGETTVDADFLIASGMLIPGEVLDELGAMDEALFIDHVDTEWCLRARRAGYRLLGVTGAPFAHSLGERQRPVWWGRRRSVAVYPPWRYYMMARNSLLLYRRRALPLAWKLADLRRTLTLAVWILLAGPARRRSLGALGRGAWAGVRRRTGPPPERL